MTDDQYPQEEEEQYPILNGEEGYLPSDEMLGDEQSGVYVDPLMGSAPVDTIQSPVRNEMSGMDSPLDAFGLPVQQEVESFVNSPMFDKWLRKIIDGV